MLQLGTDLLFFIIMIDHNLVCQPGVCHLCSSTSSYAFMISLHDDPGEGSMFYNYSDLDNFELGFYHALDTNVRVKRSGRTDGVTHR